MPEFGKGLFAAGLILAALGLIFWKGASLGLGKLPGDFSVEGQHFKIYFPLTTCILLSLIMSLIFWIFRDK
jgi:hypothetical protein